MYQTADVPRAYYTHSGRVVSHDDIGRCEYSETKNKKKNVLRLIFYRTVLYALTGWHRLSRESTHRVLYIIMFVVGVKFSMSHSDEKNVTLFFHVRSRRRPSLPPLRIVCILTHKSVMCERIRHCSSCTGPFEPYESANSLTAK